MIGSLLGYLIFSMALLGVVIYAIDQLIAINRGDFWK
jgi:hypothetical protein